MKPFESIGEPLAGGYSEISSRPAQGFLPWNPFHLLKRLKRAVDSSKTQRVGKLVPNEPIAAKINITRADLRAIERLQRENLTRWSGSKAIGGGER